MRTKIKQWKVFFPVMLSMVVFFGVFVAGVAPAWAGPEDIIKGLGTKLFEFMSIIMGLIILFAQMTIGKLTTYILLPLLLFIANYNDFIVSAPVTLGWRVVRDISNSFFVVAMLLIAFSTILGIEQYSYKKMLLKLIQAAILVNFSKTIAGVFIDIGQVIMLTFINVLNQANLWTGHLLRSFGDLLKTPTSTKNLDQFDIATTMLFSNTFLFLAILAITVVIGVYIVVLTMRIVMLWILVVLSPLPYVLGLFPGGQSYASRWWSEFTKYIIVGPLLGFFLWLSVTVMSGGPGSLAIKTTQVTNPGLKKIAESRVTAGNTLTDISIDNLTNYVLGVGLLVGGLMMTSSLSVAGGGLAQTAANKIRTGRIAGDFFRANRRVLDAPFALTRGIGGGLANLGVITKSEGLQNLGASIESAGYSPQTVRQELASERKSAFEARRAAFANKINSKLGGKKLGKAERQDIIDAKKKDKDAGLNKAKDYLVNEFKGTLDKNTGKIADDKKTDAIARMEQLAEANGLRKFMHQDAFKQTGDVGSKLKDAEFNSDGTLKDTAANVQKVMTHMLGDGEEAAKMVARLGQFDGGKSQSFSGITEIDAEGKFKFSDKLEEHPEKYAKIRSSESPNKYARSLKEEDIIEGEKNEVSDYGMEHLKELSAEFKSREGNEQDQRKFLYEMSKAVRDAISKHVGATGNADVDSFVGQIRDMQGVPLESTATTIAATGSSTSGSTGGATRSPSAPLPKAGTSEDRLDTLNKALANLTKNVQDFDRVMKEEKAKMDRRGAGALPSNEFMNAKLSKANAEKKMRQIQREINEQPSS